ncbi:MAG TPA: LytR C-terminal domain-containing protein [Caulobacteraceae bacterium]|nr:LytR C-terminal domain-containing protein [Caulobacteraceae bacterium]
MRLARLALVLALAALGACALLPKSHRFAHLKPLPQAPLAAPASIDDRLYSDAVQAIDQREYGVALDLLQAARDRKGDDVRVLNAFGVVYDKLGRFDLSSRFYAQAQALDPNSPIVRENLAYSALLQGKLRPASSGPALALLTPPVSPAASVAGGGLIHVTPTVVRLPLDALQTASARTLPFVTGHPLVLVNATGRSGVDEPVRSELARLGWTVPAGAQRLPVVRLQTEIDYAEAARPAAEALARTLPFKVAMTACQNRCEGVRLVLGADAAGWSASGWRTGHPAG